MRNRTGWVAPAVGLVFVAAYLAVAFLLGEGQDATKKSADQLFTYYRDHDTEQTIGALLIGVAVIALLFWAGHLRRVLRDAEGPNRHPLGRSVRRRDCFRGRCNRRRHDSFCARRLLRSHGCRRSAGLPGAQRLRLGQLPLLPGWAWNHAPGERNLSCTPWRASRDGELDRCFGVAAADLRATKVGGVPCIVRDDMDGPGDPTGDCADGELP